MVVLSLAFTSAVVAQASYREEFEELFTRPEETMGFVRDHSPVYSIRITGEFVCETQITLYQQEASPVIDYRMTKKPLDEQMPRISRGKKPRIWKESLSLSDCPGLKQIYDAVVDLAMNLGVENTIYQPGVIYQFWGTSLQEERYLRFVRPNPVIEGSYWGRPPKRSEDMEGWISEVLHLTGLDPFRCSLVKPRCTSSN
jgi:hypothetical protein